MESSSFGLPVLTSQTGESTSTRLRSTGKLWSAATGFERGNAGSRLETGQKLPTSTRLHRLSKGSMGHGVYHVIPSKPYRQVRKLLRIPRRVGPFPRVADVGIEADGHHDAAFVVVDPFPLRPDAAVAGKLRSVSKVLHSRKLEAIVQVVHGVKNRVLVRNLDNLPLRENHLDSLLEHLPLVETVEVVGHEKPAAQKILSKNFGLFGTQPPLADLDCIQPRPVVHAVAVLHHHALLGRSHMDARQPPDRLGKVAVRP